MNAVCSFCSSSFEITSEDLEFYEKVSPTFGGLSVSLPAPALCPRDRQRRRLAFRNERHLYHRICDRTGENIISIYSPDKPYVVYRSPEWWSESWDGAEYGRDYDESKSFFEQFDELLKVTPLEALFITRSENSDYTNLAGNNRNCYMIFNSNKNDDCMYCRGAMGCTSCLDLYFCTGCELCYECINCHNCYHLFWGQNCCQCFDSAFLFNCSGCSNCFCCTNLRHKQYCFFNQQLSRDEYREAVGRYQLSRGTVADLKIQFAGLIAAAVHPAGYNVHSDNSSGDYLTDTVNSTNCFEMYGGNSCKNCDSTKPCIDVQDAFGFASESELLYEVVAVGFSYKAIFSFNSSGLHECLYCAFCRNGSNLFGCVGLKQKEFCILNKQYSAEEYQRLARKIAADMQRNGEWGQFFPPQISPLGYNESVAEEYYPLARTEALRLGFKWSDYEAPKAAAKKVIPSAALPERIEDAADEIIDCAIECRTKGRLFRLVRQELAFYRTLGLPLPERHPDERHEERVKLRRPRSIWRSSCSNCGRKMLTSADPTSGWRVYCEECFERELAE